MIAFLLNDFTCKKTLYKLSVSYENDNIALIASAQYHLLCSSKSPIEIQSSADWFIWSIWNNHTVQRSLSPSFLIIAKLYSHIAKNGYKMLYVTARTMYMQKSTKNSLYSINQDGYSMPEGPMMMNESGYVDAIKTEIIDKVPQEFKIECLLNLLKLFPHDVEPYYAGFGNKPSDKIAYEKIGIDPGKIYIINEKGEISKNFNTKCKTNFLLIDEQIDELFPFVYDNGYNSILYSENIVNNYLPDINKIIDEKEMEDEIKALLKG